MLDSGRDRVGEHDQVPTPTPRGERQKGSNRPFIAEAALGAAIAIFLFASLTGSSAMLYPIARLSSLAGPRAIRPRGPDGPPTPGGGHAGLPHRSRAQRRLTPSGIISLASGRPCATSSAASTPLSARRLGTIDQGLGSIPVGMLQRDKERDSGLDC